MWMVENRNISVIKIEMANLLPLLKNEYDYEIFDFYLFVL